MNDTPPWKSVQAVQSTALVSQLTTSVTNTATSATQVTGLTAKTNLVSPMTQYFRVTLTGDSLSNSGANSVILTLWAGTVGTGTQVAQYSDSAASGALAALSAVFYVPVSTTSALVPGSQYTLNIGMHGSGAGTNTMYASTTAPVTMVVEAI